MLASYVVAHNVAWRRSAVTVRGVLQLCIDLHQRMCGAGANHTDLYDHADLIQLDRLMPFFQQHLAAK